MTRALCLSVRRCVAGFYLAKTYSVKSENGGLTGCDNLQDQYDDNNLGGNESWVDCATGSNEKFDYPYNTTCVACPAGKFNDVAGATSFSACKPCPPGMKADNAGSTACSSCEAGKFQGASNGACTDCPAGKFRAHRRAITG